ncbi:MAG: DUF4055 domain-containing protein [Gemmatimonadaceae bacterium]
MADEFARTGTADTTTSASSVTGSDDRSSPAFPHPTYTKRERRWKKCRAFMGESDDIREGREDYLPRIGSSEGDASYEFRLTLVAVTNFFKRAVLASVGLLLEKDPEIGDDMPAKLVVFAEDINLEGKHLSVYAKELTTDYVVDGFAATLVDFPKLDDPNLDWSRASHAAVLARQAGGEIDGADQAALGMRPFFVKYTRSEILKVVFGKVHGIRVKMLVVLRETNERLTGEFGIENVTQYRVFRLTPAGATWELWESTDSSTSARRTHDPEILRVGGKPARRIPVSLLGDFDGLPLLENLADLNIEHHNIKTNMRNLETKAMVPTRVRMGAPRDAEGNYPELLYGPDQVIEVPVMEGVQRPIYWDSPDVAVLDPAARSLQDVKADIGTAALNFLAPDKRVAETAESKRIDSAAQNASLSSVGRAVQDHIEECFGFAAEMISEKGGSVTINTDFEESPLDASEMTAYLQAAINGKLSTEQFIEAWKRGKRLDESLDASAEAEKILRENQLPPEPSQPTDTIPPATAE